MTITEKNNKKEKDIAKFKKNLEKWGKKNQRTFNQTEINQAFDIFFPNGVAGASESKRFKFQCTDNIDSELDVVVNKLNKLKKKK